MDSTPSSSGERARPCNALRLVCCTLILALAPWGALMAVDPQTEWNVASGSWFQAGNWDSGVPTEDHVAIINNGGTAEIGSAGAVSRMVRVGLANEGELQITGTLVTGDPDEEVGATSVLGVNSGGSGTLVMSGSEAEWRTLDRAGLWVGWHGAGYLAVIDGARLYTEPDANFGGQISIANQPGSEGHVIVSGAGSQIDTGHNLRVGERGEGTLLIEAGGSAISASASVGYRTGIGTATVTGPGSVWEHNGLFVGHSFDDETTGTLTVADGATLQTNNFGYVAGGRELPGNGEVLVTGQGSLWNVNREAVRISMTEGSNGQVVLADGGRLTIDDGAGNVEVVPPEGETGTIGALTIGARVTEPDSNWPVGETPVAPGALDAAEVVFGDNLGVFDAGVFFNHSGVDYHFERNDGTPINTRGHGRLVHMGTGTTTVSGEMGHTRTTAVRAGTLVVTGRIDQTGSVSVGGSPGANASFVIDGGEVQTNQHSTIGTSSSSGSATVTGKGTWQASSSINLGSANGNGTLLVEDGGVVESSGSIAIGHFNIGQGQVAVTGGGARLSAGSVRVGDWGVGTLELSDGGVVAVDEGNGELDIARQGGATGIVRIGAGSAAGQIDATGILFGADADGSLVFNHDESGYEFVTPAGGAIPIHGDGAVVHEGLGTTILPGTHTYTRDTTIVDGTLAVTGTLVSSVIVDSDGTLAGNGVVGPVDNAGTVAPGNMAATLQIDGDYSHRTGAIYEVDLESGVADLLSITGQADLQGGGVSVTVGSGSHPTGSRFTILSATGNVTGTFENLSWDDSDFEMELEYDGDEVTLVILQSPDPVEDVLFEDRFEL